MWPFKKKQESEIFNTEYYICNLCNPERGVPVSDQISHDERFHGRPVKKEIIQKEEDSGISIVEAVVISSLLSTGQDILDDNNKFVGGGGEFGGGGASESFDSESSDSGSDSSSSDSGSNND